MLEIDAERFLFALECSANGIEFTAFLDRQCGQIVFVVAEEGRVQAVTGLAAVVGAIFDRATVEAWPGRYVEIPKCEYHIFGARIQRQVIDRFLRQHGIAANLF